MKRKIDRSREIENLKRELADVRQESFKASRTGDFMRVAKMTAKAAELRKQLIEADGLLVPSDV